MRFFFYNHFYDVIQISVLVSLLLKATLGWYYKAFLHNHDVKKNTFTVKWKLRFLLKQTFPGTWSLRKPTNITRLLTSVSCKMHFQIPIPPTLLLGPLSGRRLLSTSHWQAEQDRLLTTQDCSMQLEYLALGYENERKRYHVVSWEDCVNDC